MPLIHVQNITYQDDLEPLWGCAIDMPSTKHNSYALPLQGWVLSKTHSIKAVIIRDDLGLECKRLHFDVSRPSVAAHYPHLSNAEWVNHHNRNAIV